MIHGRPRKPNLLRNRAGKSLGERLEEIQSVARSYRAREVGEADALNALAGFTLGRLLLRHNAGDHAFGISREQHDTGERWASLVRRHAALMGYSLGSPKSVSFVMVGGGRSVAPDVDDEVVLAVRRQWSDAYNALTSVARHHGYRVIQVTYGVCVENWPMESLKAPDYGLLRLGLNGIRTAF